MDLNCIARNHSLVRILIETGPNAPPRIKTGDRITIVISDLYPACVLSNGLNPTSQQETGMGKIPHQGKHTKRHLLKG